MKVLPRFFRTILAFWLLVSGSASATETLTPIKEKLYYEANWSGVNFGKIGIEIDEQADKANVTCDISSSGILSLFVKHSSHTTLEATGSNFSYPNRIYESNYHTRKKFRHVKVTYKDGKVTDEIIEPPDDRSKRPAVADDDKNAAYDLLTFLLQMRTEILQAQKDNKTNFSLNAYDGRRLTQADFEIIGEKTIKIIGVEQNTLEVSARRKFLAGYTKGELEDYDPEEPSLTIYFSNDKNLIPLRMEIPFLLQFISATLVKKCGDGESCLLGNKN